MNTVVQGVKKGEKPLHNTRKERALLHPQGRGLAGEKEKREGGSLLD